jgi:hypothetical protein
MADKLFKLRCTYCSGETKIIIEVPPAMRGKKRKKIQITRYCEHCNKPNLIVVPETWDERNPVLGDDDGFLGYSEGIPILEGEKPE